ncbi:MAG: PKD domain-containing protein [Bacteroidales bacterium]
MGKMTTSFLFLSVFLLIPFAGFGALNAGFNAKESTKTLFEEQFDNTDFPSWTKKVTNSQSTWKLGNPKKAGVPSFNEINPQSTYSLAIYYDDHTYQDESVITPGIAIEAGASCSFYACFDGVYTGAIGARFKILAENTATGTMTEIFDAGNWSAENGHERPKWLYFNLDLTGLAGQNVKFHFNYKGVGGDDVLVDDFKILQRGGNEAMIQEGGMVHFMDASDGAVTWEWNFPGGVPATSSEANPVICYKEAGSYAVSLKVTNAQGEVGEITKDAYVIVKGMAPKAQIQFPAGAYLSPYAGIFIPANVPVTFTDASLYQPTAWKWTLAGSNTPVSTQQHPQVTYPENGVYDISLSVTNKQGTDEIALSNYVQVGESLEIWNVEIAEAQKLTTLALGWFGNYGGSNWLGMNAFAEVFHAPLAKGTISEVSIFFDKVTHVSAETDITVSIHEPASGLPGKVLGSSVVKVKDLQHSSETWVPTVFKFANEIAIADSFFVSVAGIPNNMDDVTYEADDIAIAAVPVRAKGSKSTVYHLLEEWDENDQPTGKTSWVKNEDELTSFAIAPKFTYANVGSGLCGPAKATDRPFCFVHDNRIVFTDAVGVGSVTVYDLPGKLVAQSEKPANITALRLAPGIYIVKAVIEGKVRTQKIRIS